MFQDVDIPEVAKLVFDSCEFDAEFEEVSVGANISASRKSNLFKSIQQTTSTWLKRFTI